MPERGTPAVEDCLQGSADALAASMLLVGRGSYMAQVQIAEPDATYRTLYTGVWGTFRMGPPLMFETLGTETVSVAFQCEFLQVYAQDSTGTGSSMPFAAKLQLVSGGATTDLWTGTMIAPSDVGQPAVTLVAAADLEGGVTYTLQLEAQQTQVTDPVDGPWGFFVGIDLLAIGNIQAAAATAAGSQARGQREA